jgi:hypothetical protein
LTHPEHARAATPEEILAALDSRPAICILKWIRSRALEKACRASSPDDVVLVVGSLFLVGAVKKAQREGKLHLPKSIGYQSSVCRSVMTFLLAVSSRHRHNPLVLIWSPHCQSATQTSTSKAVLDTS